MKISSACISDMGGRKKNDDTVRMMNQPDGICVFVGDGLGGYEGGKIASSTAADVIEACREKDSFLKETVLQESAALANQKVWEEQKKRKGRMKTTMVVLTVENGFARWMHVGDSRLYYFVDGKLEVQTMDHSVSQVAVLMGEISQNEIRFHEDRNRVLRALGSENAKPDISSVIKLAGKREAFLLCTDGFWEYVYETEMEQLLENSKTPQEWLEKMQELLEQRVPKDNDNFSAAAVFCEAEMEAYR